MKPEWKEALRQIGPGFITGVADDDPSGIATYTQAGARFGPAMLWVPLFTFPLITAVQEISARIGRVSGHGLAGNIRRHYRPGVMYLVVALIAISNTINVGADIGGMAASIEMVAGADTWHMYPLAISIVSVLALTLLSYPVYVSVLKWIGLSIFSYVAVVFFVHVPWGEVARSVFVPRLQFTHGYLSMLTAALGTTISPYLFIWQSSIEVEEQRATRFEAPVRIAPRQAHEQFLKIKVDTYTGMAVSSAVSFFIMLTAATTLHPRGITQIDTAQQAARALEPIAGEFAFLLFTVGIVGTGVAGRADAGRLGWLRGGRSVPLAHRARLQTLPGRPFLRGDCARHADRHWHELPRHRPDPGADCDRHHQRPAQRAAARAAAGGRAQSAGDGEFRDPASTCRDRVGGRTADGGVRRAHAVRPGRTVVSLPRGVSLTRQGGKSLAHFSVARRPRRRHRPQAWSPALSAGRSCARLSRFAPGPRAPAVLAADVLAGQGALRRGAAEAADAAAPVEARAELAAEEERIARVRDAEQAVAREDAQVQAAAALAVPGQGPGGALVGAAAVHCVPAPLAEPALRYAAMARLHGAQAPPAVVLVRLPLGPALRRSFHAATVQYALVGRLRPPARQHLLVQQEPPVAQWKRFRVAPPAVHPDHPRADSAPCHAPELRVAELERPLAARVQQVPARACLPLGIEAASPAPAQRPAPLLVRVADARLAPRSLALARSALASPAVRCYAAPAR